MIIEKIDRLTEVCTNNTLEKIEESYVLSDTLQFEFEKMYNDCTKLSSEFYISFPSFPIDQLRGIRNRVAHDYESVVIRVMYDAVVGDLPSVKATLQSFLEA